MRKIIVAAIVPLFLATACSTTITTGGGSTGGATGGATVDTFCKDVATYVQEAKAAAANPAGADTKALEQQAKDLLSQSASLAAELINDPSQAVKLQNCTQQLQEAEQ